MMGRTKMSDEEYTITLKGILVGVIPESMVDDALDKVELYMRRHGFNAIVFDDGVFCFEKVE
jgi:hypothetical protein